MSKKIKEISLDELDEMMESALKYADDIINNVIPLKGKKITLQERISRTAPFLLKFKSHNIPYSILSTLILDKFTIKISEQTLRIFCQEQLDFPKSRSINIKNIESQEVEYDEDKLTANEAKKFSAEASLSGKDLNIDFE